MPYKDPEKQKAYRKAYYAANREEILARQRSQPEAKREQRRRRAAEAKRQKYAEDPEHRAKQLARSRQYHARNPEKRRTYNKAYYAANRARVLAQAAAYRITAAEARRNYRVANRGRARAREMYAAHGVWPDEWAVIWDAQGGVCYLGGEPLDPDDAVLDHDHSCCPPKKSCNICRRGLACDHCNTAIGMAADSPAQLRRMADALEAAQQAVKRRMAIASQQDSLFPDLDVENCA